MLPFPQFHPAGFFVLVSGDVERIQWTQVPMLRNDLFSTLRFGVAGGKGFGWNDQTVWKLGASWDLTNEITLRAGYNYGRTPIKSANNLINQLTLVTPQQHISGGLTWYLDSYCSELNLEIHHAFAHTLRGGGQDPLNFGAPGHLEPPALCD